jgi:ribosomal protein S20
MRHGRTMGRWAGRLLCAGCVCVLTGCRHKVTVPPLPQILVPVELVSIPEPPLPMIAPPEIAMPPMPIASAAAHPRQRRRPVVKTVVPTQTPATESDPPAQDEAASIGALSTGGDSSPRSQQEAAEMIASNDRRLNGLSPQMQEAQRAQISKVRNFQKQAQDALSSGDVEGAKTLATKAKLLLDDIEK